MRRAYKAFLLEFSLDFPTIMTFWVIHVCAQNFTSPPSFISLFSLVLTLEEYMRWSNPGYISDLLRGREPLIPFSHFIALTSDAQGVSLWGEHLGTPIGSWVQISADSDICSGKVDLGFSATGYKCKSHAGRFFWGTNVKPVR
jgi:hypothetical protein